jgi:hypothetical protein
MQIRAVEALKTWDDEAAAFLEAELIHELEAYSASGDYYRIDHGSDAAVADFVQNRMAVLNGILGRIRVTATA